MPRRLGNTAGDDENTTIDPTDISSVEIAVDGLLDKVQKNLGFTYSDNQNTPPSVQLSYGFAASIEVNLSTDWEVFTGFTLTNITLKIVVDKIKNADGHLFVQLAATATIGDIGVNVIGRIPSLSADNDVQFALAIQVQSTLDTLDPSTLIASLTNEGYDFATVESALKVEAPDLESEIEDTQNPIAGDTYAAGAVITLRKPASGAIFLQQIAITFSGDINWAIIPNQLVLSSVSLGLVLYPPTATADWTADLSFSASLVIVGVKMDVSGDISLGKTPFVAMAINVGPRSGGTPELLLDQIVGAGTSSTVAAKFQLPPTAADMLTGNDLPPFSAIINLTRDTKNQWYVQNLNVSLLWQTDFWYPIEELDFALEQVYFSYAGAREPPTAGKQPSDMSLDFSAGIGGSIILAGVPLTAVATYQSPVNTLPSYTTITGFAGNQQSVSLQQIAADQMVNPATGTARDINVTAVATNMPDSAPIDLSWCTSSNGTSGTKVVVSFTGSEFTRLQLFSNFRLDWQITSQLTVTGMGIYFDIAYPTSTEKTSVKAYGYGTVSISNTVSLCAFVAGVSQSSGPRDFLVGLSLVYDPNGSAGINPSTILNSSKVFSDSPPTDSGWVLPLSVPSTVKIVDALTSVDANVVMQIHQEPDGKVPPTYTTTLANVQASLQVTGTWTIFGSVGLTSLQLNVLVKPPTVKTNNKISYFAQLSGTVLPNQSRIYGTQYSVVLTANIDYNAQTQAGLFTASVGAYSVGAPATQIPVSTFLSIPWIGVDSSMVGKDPSVAKVPPELGLSAAALLGQPVAACTLTVKLVNSEWKLYQFTAQLAQTKQWTILPDLITIKDSILFLSITNPSSAQRAISFLASTSVVFGTRDAITASVSAVGGGKYGTSSVVTIIFNGSFQTAVSAVTQDSATNIVPQDCPILSGVYSATTKIVCTKDETLKWGLTTVQVAVTADPGTTWKLGPITITKLSLIYQWDNTTKTSTVVVSGSAVISGVTVVLNVTLLPASMLEVKIMTPLTTTNLVDGVTGSHSQLINAPTVTSAAGFPTDYTNADSASPDANLAAAGVVFKRNATAWFADNLYVNIKSSDDKWSLIGDLLWAQDIHLTVMLSHLSTQSTLSVLMGINFGFQNPSDHTGDALVKCSLDVTSKQLVGLVDTSRCTVTSFLYIATGGFWDAGTILEIPILKSLTLTMDWDDGIGTFVATCYDWSLTQSLPKLAAMTDPKLSVTATKSRTGIDFKGEISGTAHMLGVRIDLSYDLGTGPFRIYGVDVKEAYDMVKKLWEILEEAAEVTEVLAEIAEVMAALAELAGLAEIAGPIAAALLALGFAKELIDEILKQVFGDDDDDGGDVGDFYDTSINGGGGGAKNPYLVVGGSALSPGPADEDCTILVYHKDKTGEPLLPLVSANLQVQMQVRTGMSIGWTPVTMTRAWTTINNGASSIYKRPSSSTAMRIQYTDKAPFPEHDYQNTIQAEPSRFSLANSKVISPAALGVSDSGIIIFSPMDQYSQPRFGPNSAPTLTIMFVNTSASGLAPSYDRVTGFVARNDCLILPFSLPALGTYNLTLTDPSNAKLGPISISSVNSFDPNRCVVSGNGVSSGLPSDKGLEIDIHLKDANGVVYNPATNTKVSVVINLIVGGVTTVLNHTIASDLVVATYDRPPAGSYMITIMLNGVLYGGKPFNLVSSGTTVIPSVTMSIFSIWGPAPPGVVIAAGDLIEGQIQVYDNLGSRWFTSVTTDTFVVTWPSDFTPGVVHDNGNGTISFSALASTTFPNTNAVLKITSQNNPTQNCIDSPITIQISAPRKVTYIDAYGSGLDIGNSQTGTVNVRGKDQYGTVMAIRKGIDFSASISFEGQVLATTFTGESTLSYNMPDASATPLAVLVQPLGSSVHIPPALYLVTLGNSGPTVASKCFLTWQLPNTATLFAADKDGNRRREGGDRVETLSMPNCPVITTRSIVDNLDGSYSLTLELPPQAFQLSNPMPDLQVTINKEVIGRFQFPLNPKPFVSAKASGVGLTKAIVGIESTFQITLMDDQGLLTSAGYVNASAVLIQASGSKLVSATIETGGKGLLNVAYTMTPDMDPGDYLCFILINSVPLAGHPTTVNVRAATLDDFDQVCLVTPYALGQPWTSWDIDDGGRKFWTWDYTTSPGNTILNASSGTYGGASTPLKIGMRLPATEDWFTNGGMMFQFDLSIDSFGGISFAPYTQPDGAIDMTWTPDSSGSGDPTVAWQKGGNAVTGLDARWTAVSATTSSTVSYLYCLEADLSRYHIHVFQSGLYVGTGTWTRNTASPATSLPTLGVVITRQGPNRCALTFSNVCLIPTHFRSDPSATSSSSDVTFAAPWSSTYVVITNSDATLSSSGVNVQAHTTPTAFKVNNPYISQIRPSLHGHSVAVYTFTLAKSYNIALSPTPSTTVIPAILFGNAFYDPDIPGWVNWDDAAVKPITDGPRMSFDDATLYTVMVVTAHDVATVFCNGQFVFSQTRTGYLGTAALESWWIDMCWKDVRAVPALQPVGRPAMPGAGTIKGIVEVNGPVVKWPKFMKR